LKIKVLNSLLLLTLGGFFFKPILMNFNPLCDDATNLLIIN